MGSKLGILQGMELLSRIPRALVGNLLRGYGLFHILQLMHLQISVATTGAMEGVWFYMRTSAWKPEL